ncbi:hypothetical protein [Arthrobacter sulfonylureivorans]|uniref:Uncharacterized protein n=1 Tax=Arthrobacter sulfonylureivorans TaxID=2486855 RepID=A0ABY3W7A0_9MICC|nr:hypothetical protein [Arthrobacter sulfonylureivorans]UNK45356.1 hypothetical protein MNQ99_15675 [Arthrobacter sulfonylureivorans]
MSKTPAQRAKKHGAAAAPAPAGGAAKPAIPGSTRSPQRAAGNANLIVIAGAVASAFLFGYSFLLVMPQFAQLTGGLGLPDTLIGGYSTEYAQQLRTAFGEDGAGQYNYWHKTADTIFPLLFGFTWLILLGQQVRLRLWRWLAWSVVVLYVAADLGENVAVDAMLATDPVGDASLASFLTVAKSILFGLSLVVAALAVFTRKPKPAEGSVPAEG